METTAKFAEWLRNMGYQDRVPPNLQRICNPSTAIIWEQLLNKTRPKQEIEYIKNNILINRLLRYDTTSGIPHLSVDRSDYSIREIEVWNKNLTIKQQIESTKYRINELQSTLTDINKQNKIKYINLDSLKEKICEHHRFNFLLKIKAKELEASISDSEELLKQVHNSTPIEAGEVNDEDVLNTLKICSDKLCKIIEQQRNITTNNNITASVVPKIQENSIASIYSQQIFDESLGLLDGSMSFNSAIAASSFISCSNFSNYNLAILNDDILNKTLANQLHNKDRRIIWNAICKLSEMFKTDLMNAIINIDKIRPSIVKKDKRQRKLYAIHVEYELRTKSTMCEIQVLREELNHLIEILNNKYPDYYLQQSKLLKKVELNITLQQIQEHINKMHLSFNTKSDLRTANEKAQVLQDNIESALNSIKHKIVTLKEVLDTMFQSHNKIFSFIKQLMQYTVDLNWTLPLYSCVNSIEIETFLDFPLEYNRVMLDGEAKTYVRNTSVNCIPYEAKLDSNFIRMLLAMLQNPSLPAEVLLVDIIKGILKMNHLKELQQVPESYKNSRYTAEELQKQEVYLNYALDKLKTLISAHASDKSRAVLSELKSTINLWLEMPIKDFISSEHLYNDKSYDYYEKLFEKYYNQL